MYTLVRRVHSYSGLVLVLFVLMYFTTGILLTEEDNFPVATTVVETREVALDLPEGVEGMRLTVAVQERLGIRGQRSLPSRAEDGSVGLFFVRPGELTRVTLTPDLSRASVEITDPGTIGTLVNLHVQRGYGGGFVFDLWALFYDIVSVSVIVFSLSGIYLWYRRTTDRRLGWAMLALSWGFTLTVIVWLWFAP